MELTREDIHPHRGAAGGKPFEELKAAKVRLNVYA